MNANLGELLVVLTAATLSGLAGWVLSDLRRRTSALELKTTAVVMALFYMIINDPNVPSEAKRALEKAMAT